MLRKRQPLNVREQALPQVTDHAMAGARLQPRVTHLEDLMRDQWIQPATLDTEANLPLISVIIPNYNYEAYVGDAIDSALNLDWPHVEVIVVEDGSTDGSRAVLES